MWTDFVTPQSVGSPCDGVNDDYYHVMSILASGKSVYLPYANYSFSNPVYLQSGQTVIGSKRRPRCYTPVDGGYLFDVAGSDVTIENIQGDFTNRTSAGLVRLRTDLLPMERVKLSSMISFGGTSLVTDMGGSNYIVSLSITDVVGRGHRGPGFTLTKAFAYLRMTDLLVDYVGSNSHNHIAYTTLGNQGAWWTRCDTTGGVVDASTTGNHGFYFENCVANWMTDCMADTVGGGGLFLAGGNSHFYVHKFISSLCGTHPFSIVNNNRITLSACEAGGRAGQPYAPGYAGFVCVNTPNLIIDAASRGYNNAGGLSYVSNCPNSTINPVNL